MAKKFSLVEKYVRSRGMSIDDEKSKIEHTVFNFCKHQKGWFKRILSP